ncbi:MAG: hypothetical protein WAU88_01160 [Candidatus Zixiibacteriota bacterium]
MLLVKKLFIISSLIFVLLLALYGVYYFVFQNSASNPVADEKEKALLSDNSSKKASPTGSRMNVVLSEPILGATIRNGKLSYYSKRDHVLKEADLDGNNQKVLYDRFSEYPSRILWSPRGETLLYLVETDGNQRWHHLSLASGITTPLRPEMSRLVWTNLGESILYQFTDPVTGKGSLNLSNPDGQNWKKLADFDAGSYFIVPIPQSSVVSFWKRPNGLEQNKLETINLTGEGRKGLINNRYGSDFLWSKNGDHVLVGSVTDKGKNEPLIGIANSQGGEFRDLLIPSLVTKIVWSQDNATLFYALPGAFPKEAVLPNDYYSRTYPSKDTFWKMNVITGKRERLVPLEEMSQGIDASDLFLNQDETALFFQDRVSEKLYRLEL